MENSFFDVTNRLYVRNDKSYLLKINITCFMQSWKRKKMWVTFAMANQIRFGIFGKLFKSNGSIGIVLRCLEFDNKSSNRVIVVWVFINRPSSVLWLKKKRKIGYVISFRTSIIAKSIDQEQLKKNPAVHMYDFFDIPRSILFKWRIIFYGVSLSSWLSSS